MSAVMAMLKELTAKKDARIAELEAALRTTARDAEVAKRMLAHGVPRDDNATALIVARIEADCERARTLLGLITRPRCETYSTDDGIGVRALLMLQH